jgi:hypothetical protein
VKQVQKGGEGNVASGLGERAARQPLRVLVSQFGGAMWGLGYYSEGGAVPPPASLQQKCHRLWAEIFPTPPRIPETICPVCKAGRTA